MEVLLCPRCQSPLGAQNRCSMCQPVITDRSMAAVLERAHPKVKQRSRLDPEIYERLAVKVIERIDALEHQRKHGTDRLPVKGRTRVDFAKALTAAPAKGVAMSVSRAWSWMSALGTSDAERSERRKTLAQSMSGVFLFYFILLTAAGFYVFRNLHEAEPETINVALPQVIGTPTAPADQSELGADDQLPDASTQRVEETEQEPQVMDERVRSNDAPLPDPTRVDQPALRTDFAAKQNRDPLSARISRNAPERVRKAETVKAEESAVEQVGHTPDAFSNRVGDAKADALKRFGGNQQTQEAVEKGLRFLKRYQLSDGSWSNSVALYNEDEREPFDWIGVRTESDCGLTALAMLAFLGAGYNAEQGDHQECVEKGLAFLLDAQRSNGSLRDRNGRSLDTTNEVYDVAVVTLCFCEATGMHSEEFGKDYRKAARNGIKFFEKSQNTDGGWTYKSGPGSTVLETQRSDGSINGWVALAFATAEEVGIDVRSATLRRLRSCTRKLTDEDSGETSYAMRGWGDERKGFGMTAVGLATRRMIAPQSWQEVDGKAGQRLLNDLPSWNKLRGISNSRGAEFHTMYGYYYAQLGMFQATGGQGEHWTTWNETTRSMLLTNQETTGAAAGAWQPVGAWFGRSYGTIYSTTFAILMLEVYYRHLPDAARQVPALGGTPDSATGGDEDE